MLHTLECWIRQNMAFRLFRKEDESTKIQHSFSADVGLPRRQFALLVMYSSEGVIPCSGGPFDKPLHSWPVYSLFNLKETYIKLENDPL